MAKIKSIYVCSECGYESPKWFGKCPGCGEWNTMNEELPQSTSIKTSVTNSVINQVMSLNEISEDVEKRIKTGIGEFDRVLGGGIVLGSLTLISGDPGIGKSTILLQICEQLGKNNKILYVSGEESANQIKMRANRLGVTTDNLYVLPQTDVGTIIECIKSEKPDIVMIDSIQTMTYEEITSSAGSVTQVRECTNIFMHTAKGLGIPIIVVGHVNKDGAIAGPKVLEHIVDTVLQFEGDQHYMYRILRSQKNRFGSTSEIGIFEMRQDGLREVSNPSELLLSANREGLSGIAIAAAVEGIRPLLIEVQALVSSAAYGTPQRSSTGFDGRRLGMLLAVLEKRVGFKLLQKDVFLNIAGGLRVNDTAIDLAVLAAVLSSNMDMPLPTDICLTGEVGLAGEIRPVSRLDQRIQEAEKLGFSRIVVPAGQQYNSKWRKIEVLSVSRVADAFRMLFKK